MELAAEMVKMLAGAFPGRAVHGTGDAAFHGEPLIVEGATWTTRLPANAVLYGPEAARTGKRGRLPGQGAGWDLRPDRAGRDWQDAVTHVYGQDAAVQIAAAEALWHGSFKTAPGRVVLVRDPAPASRMTWDCSPWTPRGSRRHRRTVSWRWPIEPSNATGKQILGVGDACNRVQKAVERTVPFGFLIQSLLICWYAGCAYDPADIDHGAGCARGTPPRPSPRPPTCSPGCAASSSTPDFRHPARPDTT